MVRYCYYCMNPINNNETSYCPCCGKKNGEEIPSHHIMPGTVLHHKFMVGTAIGEGGFGITYIGRDLTLDMKVAIKEYYPSGFVSRNHSDGNQVTSTTSQMKKEFFDSGRKKFLKEARILAMFCGEPGIVDVRDFFEENNTVYIVMEYLEGKDLKQHLKEVGRLSPEQTLQLMQPVMRTLTKVHASGVIHRDISPDNLLLTRNGIKLIDFGAARDIAYHSHSVILKVGYAPEEQYRSHGLQGPWTDVYALSATIYKCITGITPEESIERTVNDELKKPSSLGIAIDPVVENALMKGLGIYQKDRYQSVEELHLGFQGQERPTDPDAATIIPQTGEQTDEARTIPSSSPEPGTFIYGGQSDEKTDDYNAPTVIIDRKPQKPKSKTAFGNAMAGSQQLKERFTGLMAVKKHRIAVISSVSALVLIIMISAVVMHFANKDTSFNSATYISFSGKTIHVNDIRDIAAMKKLKDVYFSDCQFEEGAFAYLEEISGPVNDLSIDKCTGITDYSSVSHLTGLSALRISECALTDDQLSQINFSQLKSLTSVNMSSNPDLSDISCLSPIMAGIHSLNVSATSVRNFSTFQGGNILEIKAEGNGLTSRDAATIPPEVKHLYLSRNAITDLSFVKKRTNLLTLIVSDNAISNISPIASCEKLTTLHISNNRITSLSPLMSCVNLKSVLAQENKLTSLNGLQNALHLSVINAARNSIAKIDGLSNCTVLEKVDLSSNKISDISLLSKSADTLSLLYFQHNRVKDISALKGSVNLKALNMDYNKVVSLAALSDSSSLTALSARNNAIQSLYGIKTSSALKYVYLSHNQIESVPSALYTCNNIYILDLSSNQIQDAHWIGKSMSKYNTLAIYNNPVSGISQLKNNNGVYLLFTYHENTDAAELKNKFRQYYVMDCPLDKQVRFKQAVDGDYGYSVNYSTADEADKLIQQSREDAFRSI